MGMGMAMGNGMTLEGGTAPRSCSKCDQHMRLSYREAVESGGELRVYECHRCRATMTVVTSGEEE